MKDLIDRKALGVGKCSEEVLPHAYCVAWNSLIDIIEKAPAVDAVEVVRCKNCKRFMEYTEECKVDGADGDCYYRVMYSEDEQFRAVMKDDFCSYGERRAE